MVKRNSLLLTATAFATLCSMSSVPAFAKEAHADRTVFKRITQLQKTQHLTDDQIEKMLKQAGWVTVSKETKHFYVDSSGKLVSADTVQGAAITPLSHADPYFITLTLYTDYDEHNPMEWVMYGTWQWDWGGGWEDNPGSYDVVSLDWDPSKFSYEGYGMADTSGYPYWVSDGSHRFDGTIIWEVRDNRNGGIWVYLHQKVGRGIHTSGEIKYTHTYTTKSTSSQYGVNIVWGQPSSLGWSYTVTTTQQDMQWSRAAFGYMTTN